MATQFHLLRPLFDKYDGTTPLPGNNTLTSITAANINNLEPLLNNTHLRSIPTDLKAISNSVIAGLNNNIASNFTNKPDVTCTYKPIWQSDESWNRQNEEIAKNYTGIMEEIAKSITGTFGGNSEFSDAMALVFSSNHVWDGNKACTVIALTREQSARVIEQIGEKVEAKVTAYGKSKDYMKSGELLVDAAMDALVVAQAFDPTGFADVGISTLQGVGSVAASTATAASSAILLAKVPSITDIAKTVAVVKVTESATVPVIKNVAIGAGSILDSVANSYALLMHGNVPEMTEAAVTLTNAISRNSQELKNAYSPLTNMLNVLNNKGSNVFTNISDYLDKNQSPFTSAAMKDVIKPGMKVLASVGLTVISEVAISVAEGISEGTMNAIRSLSLPACFGFGILMVIYIVYKKMLPTTTGDKKLQVKPADTNLVVLEPKGGKTKKNKKSRKISRKHSKKNSRVTHRNRKQTLRRRHNK
jgi:hypothetical protein